MRTQAFLLPNRRPVISQDYSVRRVRCESTIGFAPNFLRTTKCHRKSRTIFTATSSTRNINQKKSSRPKRGSTARAEPRASGGCRIPPGRPFRLACREVSEPRTNLPTKSWTEWLTTERHRRHHRRSQLRCEGGDVRDGFSSRIEYHSSTTRRPSARHSGHRIAGHFAAFEGPGWPDCLAQTIDWRCRIWGCSECPFETPRRRFGRLRGRRFEVRWPKT